MTTPVCDCGHGRTAHSHLRPGTNCSVCACPTWQPPVPAWLWATVAVLGLTALAAITWMAR